MSPARILLVGRDNICRSPFAAAVVRDEAARSFASLGVECRSGGTEAHHQGKRAHSHAVEIAGELGFDLTTHLARQVQRADLEWATHILVMDRGNVNRLRQCFPGFLPDLRLSSLAQYVDRRYAPLVDAGPPQISDLYGQGRDVFRETFGQIRRACQCFLISIQEEGREASSD